MSLSAPPAGNTALWIHFPGLWTWQTCFVYDHRLFSRTSFVEHSRRVFRIYQKLEAYANFMKNNFLESSGLFQSLKERVFLHCHLFGLLTTTAIFQNLFGVHQPHSNRPVRSILPSPKMLTLVLELF